MVTNIPNRSFPTTRMRRNRGAKWLREMISETSLHPQDLLWPVFVINGNDRSESIKSMPGVCRLTVDRMTTAAQEAASLGIPVIAIFPVIEPGQRTEDGKEATNPENLICTAVQAIKSAVPEMGILCDVALDPYTSHGHDGLLRDGKVANDETIEVLCEQAVVQANAGCDIIAPSDMMDGRVRAIRDALDTAGKHNTAIMSYSAKYASAFYGPFREALGSASHLKGNKRSYQMDPSNSNEAIHEVSLDISEGADMVMIKPGIHYLDIIYRVKQTFGIPTFAYQVSGEYAMLAGAIERGWLEPEQAVHESILAFKRAGADGILTYFAVELARTLQSG